MGKTLTGGMEHEGNINLLTPEQQRYLSMIGTPGVAGGAQNAFQQFLQPVTPESYQDIFQQSVVDPAMMQYQQSILPALQQRFVDANAGSSSALNQALAQSATDLTTALGQQYGQFYQQGQQNQLNALNLLNPLAQQRTFEPLISQSSGILGPLIGLGGQLGGAGIGAYGMNQAANRMGNSPYSYSGGYSRGY